MNRYQTIGPITTASIAAGASLPINVDAALAGFALPSSFNIVKVEIVPDTSSIFDVSVYKSDSFAAAKLLAQWDDHTGSLYYPINRTGGSETEGLEGFPIPYDDDDATGELHVKITNGAAVAHTYAYTFTIEEVPVFSAVGGVTLRGNISQPAGAYHNFGAVAGSSGYGLRDNAGSIEFKGSGGAWAAIGSGGAGVTSAIGTANQIVVSAATGAVTFSLPQSIAAASTPTFAGVVVPAIGPASGQQHALPAVTSDTIALIAATQALTNKTISGASNTLSNIGNAALTNSSLTVTAGAGLSGGGAVSLGGSVSLANAGVTSAIGTAGQVNVSGATGAVTFSLPQGVATTSTPTFAALTLTAPLTVPNGGTGVATLAANGVLYGNTAGVVLVTAQGIANSVLTANAGAPSFSATPTLTSLALTGGFSVAGAVTGMVGIGTVPTARLHLAGNMTAAAWGVSGLGFRSAAASYTDSSSTGTVASAVTNSFGIPTLLATSATVYTDAATVYIAGPPVASTNVTITRNWALRVGAGSAFFADGFQIASGGTAGPWFISNAADEVRFWSSTFGASAKITKVGQIQGDVGSAALPQYASITYLSTGAYFTAGPTYNIAVNGALSTAFNALGNVGIGTATFGTSAAKVLGLFNGVEPSTSPADMLQIFSVDLSAGNATLGIRTETAVATDIALASTHSLQIRLNGATYKLGVTAV